LRYQPRQALRRSGPRRVSRPDVPDVLVPQLGPGADELGHEPDALRVVHDLDPDALVLEVLLGSLERLPFADADPRDAVQQDGAAAHAARAEGRVEDAAAVFAGREAAPPPALGQPGVLQAVHLGVQDDAFLLDALVVPPADDRPVEDQDGA